MNPSEKKENPNGEQPCSHFRMSHITYSNVVIFNLDLAGLFTNSPCHDHRSSRDPSPGSVTRQSWLIHREPKSAKVKSRTVQKETFGRKLDIPLGWISYVTGWSCRARRDTMYNRLLVLHCDHSKRGVKRQIVKGHHKEYFFFCRSKRAAKFTVINNLD